MRPPPRGLSVNGRIEIKIEIDDHGGVPLVDSGERNTVDQNVAMTVVEDEIVIGIINPGLFLDVCRF